MAISVEKRAIKAVMKFERKQGRKPVDVHLKFVGYDIKSSGRFIEVKSRANRTPNQIAHVTIENTLIRNLGTGIARYYIYLVAFSANNKARLVIIPPKVIFHNLKTYVKFKLPGSVWSTLKIINLN